MYCCNLLLTACNCMATYWTEQPFLSHQLDVAVVDLLPFSFQVSTVNVLLQNSPLAVTIVNMFVNANVKTAACRKHLLNTISVVSCFHRQKESLSNTQHVFCLSLSLHLSIWRTDSYQHYVWFWDSNPELSGGKQVNLPGRLCGQSSDMDRVSSVAGGGSRPWSGLASGNHPPTHTHFRLRANWRHSFAFTNLREFWAEMALALS